MCGMHAKDELAVGRVAARGFVCLVVKHDRQNNKFMNNMDDRLQTESRTRGYQNAQKQETSQTFCFSSLVLLLAFS